MTTATSLSSGALFHSPGIGEVRWTSGFWKRKTELCSEVMIPDMLAKLMDSELSHCWTNFLVAAGRMEGEHEGPPFHDGDFYKWLEAACYSLAVSPDEELRHFVDSAVEIISEIQEDDGYIFTQRAIETARNGNVPPPLENEINFEVYNLGHLMTAGCIHHRSFGNNILLDVAVKAAGYLDGVFSEVKPELAKTAVCPSHYMGLAELYRTTREQRWLKLLKRLIALRDRVADGTDDNQDRIPLAEHREIIGHAVRANYLYAGVSDLLLEESHPELSEAVDAVWKDLTSRKMYVTGSCGALYDGVSPYGSWDYDGIQRVHQAYGRAYELPNVTAYNETCAAIGSYLWNWRMFLRTGQSKYINLMETILYNGALAGISLDGTKYFYVNTLRRHLKLPYDLKWSRSRESYITSFCCPPNLVRTIMETPSYAYALGNNPENPEIRVLFYGANRAALDIGNGTEIELVQSCDYPWDGRISLILGSVKGPGRFTIGLRIPGWADTCDCRVNDTRVDQKTADDGFLSLNRDWKSGDRIDLTLPLDIQLMEAHPLIEELIDHLCVSRGPLIYCLESGDLPENVPVSRIRMDRDMDLEGESLILGDETMTVLKGYFRLLSSDDADNSLYRRKQQVQEKKVPATLVPYYAWDNRGYGEMTVWLPSGGDFRFSSIR